MINFSILINNNSKINRNKIIKANNNIEILKMNIKIINSITIINNNNFMNK